ncbi:MAG: glutamyl-tRNA reductase [Deltaproteobacteria bacterium]|nr:glutamyl-tRNA reductase [Deltaproteobacteria bacterium]MDQ3298440.1 glutamyl-tRNA reductase [Myxococcota bacterium]
MSELFVVGISWRTAVVAIREKLAFRDEELVPTLRAMTKELPVAEALLVSTCNRVEVYGVARPGQDATSAVRRFLAEQRGIPPAEVAESLYDHRGNQAVRHVFRVAAALDSLVLGEAQILGQLKSAYGVAGSAGTSGPVLGRCLERAFGVAKRVRSETAIARGASNVSTVAVELASRVFGDLSGKHVLVIGAGKMSTLAARHLYSSGAQRIVVTNRSPEKAEALASEIDGIAKPWSDLEGLLVDADVVISSTGAREPILTRPLFKKVTKGRRWRPMMVIDIAVPRDAEPAIGEFDGVFLYDIDDLEKVVAANLSERAKAGEQASKIVEHEAGQFEHWLRSQGVVPTIRALRSKFAQVADAEVAKALDQLSRREHTPAQQRELVQRVVQLVVNKLLHQPTAALREARPDEASLRAEVLCELFGLDPIEGDRESQPVLPEPGRDLRSPEDSP